ncbi:MAG: phenylalanine--tRNA ligase subunit beta [Firmicutes bacterium]|nr:phenylalanine--tRNA ligase subunit beta [Bacillota bacterium]
MLISCNKLKSYIKNSNDIDWLNIWDTFTIRTAEVEGVEKVGDSFDNVVVAEIKKCEEHPNSDHMHVLQIDCGEKELIQVVCGAPNVRVGLKTAYVKVGGHIDGLEITAKPLRDVISNGMCCSRKELGISDNHDGILELPEDWEVGKNIKDYLPIEDIIVEIDNKSLTNRPDLWGHFGIAREIAAITDHELIPLEIEEVKNDQEDLDIKINEPNLCLRFSALKIDNITNNKTPLDMQIFLYYVGMRSISLLVDLTNYVMLEIGQPMHAYDSRVVKNIVVDKANNKDTYKTLDGVERILTDNMLMIKNDNQYFGIAGVMGGLDSEISEDTTSTFIESASFSAVSVRKTATALGLRTEASARFEKSLDPNYTIESIKRFLHLLRKENPNLKIASNLTDIYPTKLEERTISLSKKRLAIYMDCVLKDMQVKNILEKIGCQVTVNDDSYKVIVPTYRCSKDITIEQDLIEEIARFYGLENFEAKPLKVDLTNVEHENIFTQEYDVKRLLATKYDMHEVHSYLWYDTELLKELNIEKEGVKLLGKTENNVLRDELSLSLMNIVKRNFKNYSAFNIFEIGTIIKNNEPKRRLSIILADDELQLETIYNKAKNIIKYIYKILKNIDVTFTELVNEKTYYDETLGKNICWNNLKIGQLNVLDKSMTNKIAKKKSIVCVEIDFDEYVNITKDKKIAKEISKYPNVTLDYTIILGDKKYSDLEKVLKEFRSNLIIDYKLNDVYNNKYTIRYVLGSDHKTLEHKDLQNFKERFIEHIKNNGLDIIE